MVMGVQISHLHSLSSHRLARSGHRPFKAVTRVQIPLGTIIYLYFFSLFIKGRYIMNIKITAESRQEEILYYPHHLNFHLIGYTKINVIRNYHIRHCSKKDIDYILSLSNRELSYFFFGTEKAWVNLFRDREPDYVDFEHSSILVLDKHPVGGFFDITLSVSCSFVLYVKESPSLDFLPLFYFSLITLFIMVMVYLFY